MLGKIDALIVDHRHPKYHLLAATPYVEAGVPTFIDKPLCFRSKEGKAFFALAKKKKTPITSFSTVPHWKTFKSFQRKLERIGPISAGTMYGPCDLESEYGGVFFYGIHQVEAAMSATTSRRWASRGTGRTRQHSCSIDPV